MSEVLDLSYHRSWYKDHFFDFLREIFPQHFTKEFSQIHHEIFSILNSHNRIAIAAPRRSGKSQIITFGWVMWKLLCHDDSKFVILIANNYNNALKFLAPIKEELEFNPQIIALWGKLKSDKWSENEIELRNKKKVIVGGNDFKIRGQKYLQYRPDLIVVDDAEDDELVRSDVRRGDFEHWLLYGVEPAMSADKNQIIFVGTVLHRDSQLSKLQTCEGRYKDWYAQKFEALVENKSIWEEGLPTAWLIEERTKDPYKFAQEYMNNPVPYEHAAFKEEYFDNYTDDKLPKDLLINVTVDLACSDKTYSDYTVIMPVGIDALGDLWVLPYIRGRYIDPDEIINKIFDVCKRYIDSSNPGWKFGKLGIEKVSFQRFLIHNFHRERKKRGIRIIVEELEAKGDKVQRILQLQPLFASGDIHVRENMLDLKEELLDFPRARHDDAADTLSMHINYITKKPSIKNRITEKFSVTPEKQRTKVLNRLKEKNRIHIYSNF